MPLSPVFEVTPRQVSFDENITVDVEVSVNVPSNVSASEPVLSGTGDAALEFANSSIILQPGQVGTLEWIYDASKPGSIAFGTTLVVRNLNDNTVSLTQQLNSPQIGVTRVSQGFVVGIIILTLYICLSSRFDWFKPKESYIDLFGGAVGILYSLMFLGLGYLFAILCFSLQVSIDIAVSILGVILILFGLTCCFSHNYLHIHNRDWHIIQKSERKGLTELTGLNLVIFGLSGFFLAWQIWTGLFIIIALGIVAIAKEIIEMELQ